MANLPRVVEWPWSMPGSTDRPMRQEIGGKPFITKDTLLACSSHIAVSIESAMRHASLCRAEHLTLEQCIDQVAITCRRRSLEKRQMLGVPWNSKDDSIRSQKPVKAWNAKYDLVYLELLEYHARKHLGHHQKHNFPGNPNPINLLLFSSQSHPPSSE